MDVDVERDTERSQLTLRTELDASTEQVWRLWSNPDALARWWGPPGQEMTVTRHQLTPGGAVEFFVTDAAGARQHGRFDVHRVRAPHELAFTFDAVGFGSMELTVTISPTPGPLTRMTVLVAFGSAELMARGFEIGFDAGITRSVRRAAAALS